MDRTRRLFVAGLLVLTFGGADVLHGRQAAPAAPAAVTLTPAEMEQFLLHAKIVNKKRASKGVTNTTVATLSDGRVTHDAQIQTVDEHKMVFEAGKATELNFKDTYRFNIGAYRLAQLLGLENVPMSVKRNIDGKPAAMTWWIDDVQFDEEKRLKQKNPQGPNPERTAKQMYVLRVFDELIQNKDRNTGNMQWTNDWTLWMIDHTRGFRLGKDLLKPDQLARCDRALFEAMKKLTQEDLTKAMGDIMQKDEMSAVLARRDQLVKFFEDRIARRGEAVVLFTM
jgi:hypothetical protein